jgi:glycosyltransferase involved in cell wall biosynthesis
MTRRLRVVHVTGCLDMGGQEKLLVEFAGHADRDRFELRCVSLTNRGALADELESLACPVEALGMAPGLYPAMQLRLAKLFRGWGTDIVHTHNERPLLYAAPAGRLARVACVVHTKHGRGTGNSRRQNALAALAVRLTDPFVCVSQDSARLAEQQGISPKRVRIIVNGIDTHKFAAHGPCPTGPAMMVARLCPEKDHATLLHAVALVVREAPNFRLAIAGTGPCLPELQQLAERLQLGSHVQFLGMVDDVPGLLRRARLKVLSSVSEGMPLTLLEAMAAGLPVVSTNVGGVPEVVEDNVTGLLVPPRDPATLASALLRFERDEALGRRFGQEGRRRVEQRFDIRRMVAEYEQIYVGARGA